jgi:hypothetical protein
MSDVDNEMRGDIYQFKMADLILEPSTRPYTVAQP